MATVNAHQIISAQAEQARKMYSEAERADRLAYHVGLLESMVRTLCQRINQSVEPQATDSAYRVVQVEAAGAWLWIEYEPDWMYGNESHPADLPTPTLLAWWTGQEWADIEAFGFKTRMRISEQVEDAMRNGEHNKVSIGDGMTV